MPIDSDAVRELVLYAQNNGRLYAASIKPVMLNMARRVRLGRYNAEASLPVWRYVANAAARCYTTEFGAHHGTNGSYGIFDKATRDQVAIELRDYYDETMQEMAA